MSSRRPPSQRNAEYAQQRFGRQLQSMTPGTAGGRLASAAPVRVGSDVLAAVEPGLDGSAGIVFTVDTFSPSSPVTSLALTYVPADGSLHVYMNGVEQHEGTDYTLSGLTITLLPAMGLDAGDVVDARYAYTDTSSGVIDTTPAGYSSSATYGSSAPAGGTASAAPLAFIAGDLLVLAFSCQYNATPPSGFTAAESSTGLLQVWTKTATDSTDDLTLTGITDQFSLVAYAFSQGQLDQHGIGNPATASNAAASAATPSLTATRGAYALHIWGMHGDYSASRVTQPSDLQARVNEASANTGIGTGFETTVAGASTSRTATATSFGGTVNIVGVQLLVSA